MDLPRRTLPALAVVLALAGCAAPLTVDVVAEDSCRRFDVLLDEASTMTDDEIRDQVKAVHDKGRHADDAAVADASKQMVEAATSGDADEFQRAVSTMALACAPHRAR